MCTFTKKIPLFTFFQESFCACSFSNVERTFSDVDTLVLIYLPSINSLKAVGNEKGGGFGGWLLFEDGFGPWRSMSVCFLILLSSFLQRIPVSVFKDQLIGDWYENRQGAPNC